MPKPVVVLLCVGLTPAHLGPDTPHLSALAEAGFSLADVVRATYIVTDASYADAVFSVVGRYFATTRPAATMMIAGLIRPEMKIEIEVTARKRDL